MSSVEDEENSKDVMASSEDANLDREDPESDHSKVDEEQEMEEQPPSIELQFLPPDQRSSHHGDLLLAAVVEPEIEDDTEAAEALRANAQIKVGKVSKAARGINAQTVRKLVKVASLRGRGIKRGKPPRVSPGLAAAGPHHQQQIDHLVLDVEDNQIYAVQEEDDESDAGERSDGTSDPPSVVHNPKLVLPTNESENVVVPTGYEDTENEDEVSNQSPKHSLDGAKSSKGHKGLDHYTPVTNEDHEGDIPKDVVAETMDVERKLMGELDPHNMLQVQRWRKKKKSGKKKRKSYVKGKVIDGKHELYTLSIAVMLGVRTSIARTNTIISSSDGCRKRILSPQDFMAEEKYEFAPKVRI